jgi:S-adenosylmethionine:diacylglycerol 3-amino-3-carboxypropyl transferase
MAMQRCAVPVDLVRTARIVVDSVARNIANDGSGVYSALLASQLYETIKTELARTPRQWAATVGVLSAALDQCRHAAVHVDSPDLMEGELRAAVETLERGMQAGAAARTASAPRFMVIEGGLSAASSG